MKPLYISESLWTAVRELFEIYKNTTFTENEGSKTAQLKGVLGNEIVDSFSFRTCVNPKLSKQESGETNIAYQSLTAQDLLKILC